MAPSGRQRYAVLGAFDAITHELIQVSNTSYITAETVCQLRQKIAAAGMSTGSTIWLQ
jgi:hypothetical protein